MTSSSTPTKAAKKAPAKKVAKKAAGSSRVAALASKLATSPGSVKATASLPATSGDTAAATASLLGLSPAATTPPVPAPAPAATEPIASPTDQSEPSTSVEQTDADAAEVIDSASDLTDSVAVGQPDTTATEESIQTSAETPAEGAAEGLTGPPIQPEPETVPAAADAMKAPQPLALVPDPAPAPSDDATEDAAEGGAASSDEGSPPATPDPAQSTRSVQPVQSTAPARRPAAKKVASTAAKKSAAPAEVEAEETERLDELVWTLSSPEHSLDQQHDRISKLTLELPIPLVDVLNRWELDQVRRTGRRLYRERLIDLALAELPSNMDKVVTMARDLPAWLKYAETEQVGSRVRAPVALELKVMKQELKLRREKGTYVRHIYAVALLDFLTSYGVPIEEPAR